MTDDEALRAFENGSYPKEHWNHAAHLRMAGCYLTRYAPAEALVRMREGVRKYNEATGGKNTDDSTPPPGSNSCAGLLTCNGIGGCEQCGDAGGEYQWQSVVHE